MQHPIYRTRGPFFRARDLSGAGDAVVRDPLIFRAHDPAGVRDSGAGDFAPRNPTYPT